MSTFTTASPSTVEDPHKRVHYSTGLVLGVDEFEQEQAHLLERDRLHNRALHGYGTVYGLRLTLEEAPELRVSPGLAVVPSGQHVCIEQPQCAVLDDWFEAQDFDTEVDLEDRLETSEEGAPVLPVYVVLCYRECTTDSVPVSGAPCRSAEDSMVPSRIAEDFELQLRLTPPPQASEHATEAFGTFLRRIQATEHEDRALDEAAFEEAVRGEIERIADQIGAGTPPGAGDAEGPILIPASNAHAFLERAFQLWSLHAGRGIEFSSNRCGDPSGADPHCVQLGRVDLTLRAVEGDSESPEYEFDRVSDDAVSEDDRPVLIETRLLQESLTQGGRLDAATLRRTLATVSVEAPETLRLWIHHDSPLQPTGEAPFAVTVNGEARTVNGITEVGSTPSLNAFDLALDAPVAPGDRIAVQVHLRDVEEEDTGESLLDRLDAEGPGRDYLDRSGETVPVYTVAPVSTLSLGDLADVDVPAQMDREHVLAWNPEADAWQNTILGDADSTSVEEVATTLPTLPFATADLVDPDRLGSVESPEDTVAIRIRFHLNTHETVTTRDNAFDVEDGFPVQVLAERDDPMSNYLYLTKESIEGPRRLTRNVFVVFVGEEAIRERPHVRIRFDLAEMTINQRSPGNGARGEVAETYPATEWIAERPIKWVGHDGTQYVTVFAARTPVGGDLSGPTHAPRVTGLQGTSVVGPPQEEPEEDDLLVLDVDEDETRTWVPTPPSELNLDFVPVDHTHTLDDLEDVSATDYVQTNPETDEPYALVAAGRVNREGTVESAYGGLQAEPSTEDGIYALRFAGYQEPEPGVFSYVVKGTPVMQEQDEQERDRVGAAFSFVRFEQDAVIVRSVLRRGTVQEETFTTTVEPLPFMVEISRVEGRDG